MHPYSTLRSLCALPALAIAIALFTAFPIKAQTGAIRVEVLDPAGAPVEAVGHLVNRRTGLDRAFETTAGAALLEQVPFGRYRLSVSRLGFAPQSVNVDLHTPITVTQRFALQIGAAAQSVTVVGATPLAGTDQTADEIPAPVQTASDRDIEASGALDLSDFLNRRLNGVYLNEVQGNPVQPDLNYRGYTASPLLGTPQGVSVYMDGIRLNQPFGDIVSWDLIPRIAISETTLIPGSNPLFGLNTLGGALSLGTKDGRSHPGSALSISGGSFGRKMADFEHGGSNSKGLSWYGATNFLFEDGWREQSPSNVRQFFGKLGWQGDKTVMSLGLSYANNSLHGNGIQDTRFLSQSYSSAYTLPDITNNKAPMAILNVRRILGSNLTVAANGYYRYIRTSTLNGDINEGSLDQSMYQPSAAEINALRAAGYTGFPTSGANAANTPFPYWRCIGQALLGDEPGEKCNGLINRAHALQRNYGVSGQLHWLSRPGSNRNQLTIGAAWDGNNVSFEQSTQLGYLAPDRSVVGINAYADGVTGGEVDGEPFDNRVNLRGRINTGSVYFTDTWTLGTRLNITASGRFNRSVIDNTDRILPGGVGSLTGKHAYNRFNPAAGFTYRITSDISSYFNYAEGNRAPTSIELGCADPASPCKLPNAMAGDPPLNQVVTRTLEAGIRGGSERALHWSVGYFRASNRDDILFVAAPQNGFGFFKNFGRTLRQGVEADAGMRIKRLTSGLGYTFLNATFESPEEVNGSGNSANDAALAGTKGLESEIQITPGNQIPLIPQHMLKIYSDIQLTSKATLDVNVLAISGSYARGNENNLHRPDGTYYLGPGTSPAYAVVNLGARYQLARRVEFFVRINNLLNRRYYTAAQLGPTGFTSQRTFIARPFPAVNGEFPVQQGTFYAPGAPIGAWGGMRLRF